LSVPVFVLPRLNSEQPDRFLLNLFETEDTLGRPGT